MTFVQNEIDVQFENRRQLIRFEILRAFFTQPLKTFSAPFLALPGLLDTLPCDEALDLMTSYMKLLRNKFRDMVARPLVPGKLALATFPVIDIANEVITADLDGFQQTELILQLGGTFQPLPKIKICCRDIRVISEAEGMRELAMNAFIEPSSLVPYPDATICLQHLAELFHLRGERARSLRASLGRQKYAAYKEHKLTYFPELKSYVEN